ncbi:MAG: hypothetical protein FJ290_13145 [Planctomycetes bacterium]|nr:hypothetical protein [Planctomycetota bacterium]
MPFALCLLPSPVLSAAGYHLIENFTAPLPASGPVSVEADYAQPKVGLAAARLAYSLTPKQGHAWLGLPNEAIRIPEPGHVRLWAKGNGSGDELQFTFLHAEPFTDQQGNRHLRDHKRVDIPAMRLDFTDWRELTFDLSQVPKGRSIWWERLDIRGRRKEGEPTDAVVLLDDLRLYPAAGAPPATLATRLLGPPARDFAREVALAFDVRSFVAAPAKVQARLTLTDRNGSRVAAQDFPLALGPNEAKELKLELKLDNPDAFLPPFTLEADVASADLPQLSQRTESKVVMANSVLLFDDFSDVAGRWFTAGFPESLRDGRGAGSWNEWCHGEAQRCSPWAQTSAAIRRVDAAIPYPTSQITDWPKTPTPTTDNRQPTTPGFALRFDYAGDAVAYNGRERYLPGNAFRLGVWVKGDGSASRLSVLTLDYTDAADFWPGGWRRIRHGELPVCTLDFADWRYIVVPLPGNGLGSNAPRGSTNELDFPLELTAFRIAPEKPDGTGTVLLGPIVVHTQQEAATTLAVHVGYDDPDRRFDPKHGAWATVQNASPARARKVRATWALLDRAGEAIASGTQDLSLAPTQFASFRIDLAKQDAGRGGPAHNAASRLGPLRLQVVASDAADGSVSATRELVLAKPDSVALLTGFESGRGYLGLKALGLDTSPPAGKPAAATSAAQARSGKRSLAFEWDKAKKPAPRHGYPTPRALLIASIDPPLPGIPTDIELWLHGDRSGALFYPLIGDTEGVSHGGHFRTFDLFLAEVVATSVPLVEQDRKRDACGYKNAVKVDWQGWRKLEFRLPGIPPGWNKPMPVLGFVPSYPLGLHLAVDPADATTERGTLYVDDVRVRTHLEPATRLSLSYEPPDDSNILPPGASVRVTVSNSDAVASRAAAFSGGVFDWRGRRLNGVDEKLALKPGETRDIEVAKALPPGAFALRAKLTDGNRTLASIEEDILAPSFPGGLHPFVLASEWKLRAAVQDRFTLVDEDWDWVEHHAGNVQLDSARQRMRPVGERGAEPWLLLGYSAYWAAGVGLEQLKAGAFERRLRDAGHAVDTFLVPERPADWDSYACEVMRALGKDVAGFVLWNNPEAGPIAVPPERFARMLKSADKWRRRYCPQTPLLLGGMNPATAAPYIRKLAEHGAADCFTGINVRLDVGRLSPEDARVVATVRDLQAALREGAKEPKSVLLTDLDWAVESGERGLSAFDQAAYLTRSELLLHALGICPALSITNMDHARLGLGLTHRRRVWAPPLAEQPETFQLRPAWWAIARTRQLLDGLTPQGAIEVQDVVPDRTRCLLYTRKPDGKAVTIAWRNADAGEVSFAHAGTPIEAAEDIFGTPVPVRDGWHAIGKVPVLFTLGGQTAGLSKLWVRDAAEPAWPQRVLAVFTPTAGGEAATLAGRTVTGAMAEWSGVRFPKGGVERFTIAVPAGADLVLRKRFLLDGAGQKAEVLLDGKPVGTWDLTRSAAELQGGLREAIFFVPMGGKAQAAIEVRYQGPANTAGWCALEYRGGDFPLSAVGPLHADQNVGALRWARNTIGAPLAIGQTRFANGMGVFAQSLQEFALNGQFRRFTATIGVDAVTEGRGSVVFEVHADGKKLWASPVMSGLDEPRKLDLDVSGVNRLRLVVTDAGDGNKGDAADWAEPTLHR